MKNIVLILIVLQNLTICQRGVDSDTYQGPEIIAEMSYDGQTENVTLIKSPKEHTAKKCSFFSYRKVIEGIVGAIPAAGKQFLEEV